MTRLRVFAAGWTCAWLLSGCAISDLAFREDDRVEIIQPDDRSEVRLPVTIRWRADLERAGDGPFFAVFVDREPVRPGQSLRALADDACNRSPDCPDVAYLRDQYVFVTDQTSVTLDAVPTKRESQRTQGEDRHEATIVLVDRDGRRIGEAAYTVEFVVEED
jgi:hypothetical protein